MQLTLPKLPFDILITSRQLVSGQHINYIGGLLTSFVGALTARAGGAQAGSPILDAAFNEITTVTSANDSVQLPIARVGLRVCVTNSGAGNSLQIFANQAGTDTINGTAGATGVALAQNATALFICTKTGVWRRFVSS